MRISYLPYLRKRTATAEYGTLYIRVTYQRKHIYINISEALPCIFWDKKRGIVKSGHPTAELLNDLIHQETHNARARIIAQRLKGQCLDFDSIKALLGRKENGLPLSALVTEYIAAVAMPKASQNHMAVTLKHCIENKVPSDITEITQTHITNLRTALLKKCQKSTVNQNLKRLKTLFNYAVKKKYLATSPAAMVKLGSDKQNITFLSEAELLQIDTAIPKMTDEQKKVARMFLFGCYSGLRFSDLIKINQGNIVASEYGRAVLFTAQKTSKQSMMPLNPMAEKYLPYLNNCTCTNQHYNRTLKDIAALAKVDKVFSSHIARHTFATLGTSKGIKLEVMQSLLQHGNIKTTQGYAHLMEKTKWEEMSKWAK